MSKQRINELIVKTLNVSNELSIGGDAVTATASELNAMDGITASVAELNILDGVTSDASELNILDGVTSDAGELNILDGVTSDAGELNILDGVTVTAGELNALDGSPASATIVVGTEVPNDINVTIQLEDADGTDIATRASVFAYLSDDANGDSVTGTAPDGGVAIGTDGLAIPIVAGKFFLLTSESDGDIDITLTDSGTPTFYLIVIHPSGLLTASGAITFA